jgi:cytidine deaminase
MPDINFGRLFAKAREVRKNAYVPYSKFPVAACVLADDGSIFAGVNVDNASFPETSCAEANAIGAMILSGQTRIKAVLVLGGSEIEPGVICTPCGGCRQRLNEFTPADVPVYSCGPEGLRDQSRFGDLLPKGFGPANLNNERGASCEA